MPTTPEFDIHAWNEAANAELLVEFQKMAITLAGNLEKPKGYRTTAQYVGGVPTAAIVPPITVRPLPRPTRPPQRRCMSRTVWFAVAGAFFADLPAVICASPENRAAAIGTMIANMSLAGAAAGATVVVIEAIKRALQGACEGIVTRAASNLVVSTPPYLSIYTVPQLTSAAVLSRRPGCLPNKQSYAACGLAGISTCAFVTNAFISLWHRLGASLAQAPKTAEHKMKLFRECWSPDQLVSTCASGMAAAATFAACSMLLVNPAAVGVASAILHLAFCALMDGVVERKKDRGVTWGAWVRGLIVSDERARMWTTDGFDLVEEAITDALICPITKHLVYVHLYD